MGANLDLKSISNSRHYGHVAVLVNDVKEQQWPWKKQLDVDHQTPADSNPILCIQEKSTSSCGKVASCNPD